MRWGTYDGPYPLSCEACGEVLGEDGGWIIDGVLCCPECTKQRIANGYTLEELARDLGLRHVGAYDERDW